MVFRTQVLFSRPANSDSDSEHEFGGKLLSLKPVNALLYYYGVPFCFIKLKFELKLGIFLSIIYQESTSVPQYYRLRLKNSWNTKACLVKNNFFGV